MRKEFIKSIVLTLLVVLSLFFTWAIWTIPSSYNQFHDSPYLESKKISEETRDLHETIRPYEILFHKDGVHYGTTEMNDLRKVWDEICGWPLIEMRDISNQFQGKEFLNFINGENGKNEIDLLFYNEVPMKTFLSIFNWKTDDLNFMMIDRIIIPSVIGEEEQKIYFISSEQQKVVETVVKQKGANLYINNLFSKKNDFTKYSPFDINKDLKIFLPKSNVKMKEVHSSVEDINGEEFKQALFIDPKNVKRDKDTYTDGTRVLNIFPSEKSIKYDDRTIREPFQAEPDVIIQQSIDFLNAHGGWTNDYILFNSDENYENQEVKLRLAHNSYPIFKSSDQYFGSTFIRQIWGKNEIAIYERPSYQLKDFWSGEDKVLFSGREVVDFIKNHEKFDVMNIKNVFLAYELAKSSNNDIVKLNPIWCVQMKDGSIEKIPDEQENDGGDLDGLE